MHADIKEMTDVDLLREWMAEIEKDRHGKRCGELMAEADRRGRARMNRASRKMTQEAR